MKRIAFLVALAAVVALPFVLRTRPSAPRSADETLVIVTPHNEAIRFEFGLAFRRWYRERTGRTIAVDWRVLGGTSEIARFLDGEYITAFGDYWTHKLGKPWSAEIQAGSQNGKLPGDAPAVVREARDAFLASDVSCGIDLFFGGGTYDFDKQATAGRLVPADVFERHPDWFDDRVIPQRQAGEDYWDPRHRWIGCVLSSYGIIYNRDSLRRLGFRSEPKQWNDLADPRLAGEVALCDPTKSGSIAKAFENVIQQNIHRVLRARQRDAGDAASAESAAVREGWLDGLRLIQLIGANARYFTDTSQKPPIDVSAGDCAAGMCIDFYGRAQAEAAERRSGVDRIGYESPAGGAENSVDPVGILRGAKNKSAANAFIEFVLSMEGQRLWNQNPGTPGGPEQFALRRLPVRRDYYDHEEWREYRSDPDANPYAEAEPLVYHPEWTGRLFREMAFIVRVMCQDTHDELVDAWKAICAAPADCRARALAELQDLSAVDYDRAGGDIKRALGSKNKVDEVHLARELGDHFRNLYKRAAATAKKREPQR